MAEQDGLESLSRGASSFAASFKGLLPCVAGLAASRVVLVSSGGGCYRSTDDGVFTDGASVVALAIIGFFTFLLLYEKRLSDRAAMRLTAFGIAGSTVAVALLGFVCLTGAGGPTVRFALTVCVSALSLVTAACWVRCAGARTTDQATALVFGAFGASEVVLFLMSFLPDAACCVMSTVAAAAQFACLARPIDRAGDGRAEEAPPRFDDCYVYMRAGSANAKFFAACAIGIAAMALVVGFLRGFPFGEPIPFTIGTRVACLIATEALFAVFALAVVRRRTRAMTVGIWVVMELLAAVTLVLYCAFPHNLEVGGVTVTVLSTLMSAFVLYIVSTLMAVGKKEPLSYALRMWFLWLGSRAIGRFVLLALLPIGSGAAQADSHMAGTHLAGTVVSLLLLVSTQIILVKLMDVERFAAREEIACGIDRADGLSGSDAKKPSALERWLGVEEAPTSLDDVRQAAMRRSAEEMGRRFLLSNREIEVLSLYALGHTQKRLAEELCVSQATIRTHVKRIYAKCGLHSRQELLDYLSQYGN